MHNPISIHSITKKACKEFHHIIGKNKTNDDNIYFIGAFEDNKLIGVLSYYDEKEVLLLNKVYLLSEYRAKGYGRLLVDHLKNIAKENKVNILAKIYSVRSDEREKIFDFILLCGFDSPNLTYIYFILDFEKSKKYLFDKKFETDEILKDSKCEIYTYKELKKKNDLFQYVKENSREFNSLDYLEDKKANVYESFFVYDNKLLGWFVFEIKNNGQVHIDSLFTNPDLRYSALGIRIMKLLFDQIFSINPQMKTIIFNIDPEKQHLVKAYKILFRDSIINTIKVWYSYFYIDEN